MRQRHLEVDPQSVGTLAKDFKKAPREMVESMLKFEASPSTDFILGAFLEEELIGMLGFKREVRKGSTLHKGTAWGFFVVPEQRNLGVGRKLVAEALEEIKQYEWCEMIRVMITTTDTAAIKIAEVFGFERYGTEKKSLKINGNYFDDHYYNKYFDR